MKIRLITSLLIISFLPTVLFATTQARDKFVVGSKIHHVLMFKLSPELEERIEGLNSSKNGILTNSGNWDGFYAKLELREERLHLTGLSIDWSENDTFTTKDIDFGSTDGIFCDWFTGELRDVKMGKHRKIKKIVHFHFLNGILTETTTEKDPLSKRKKRTNQTVDTTPVSAPR